VNRLKAVLNNTAALVAEQRAVPIKITAYSAGLSRGSLLQNPNQEDAFCINFSTALSAKIPDLFIKIPLMPSFVSKA
jgi:hypothetical protein